MGLVGQVGFVRQVGLVCQVRPDCLWQASLGLVGQIGFGRSGWRCVGQVMFGWWASLSIIEAVKTPQMKNPTIICHSYLANKIFQSL